MTKVRITCINKDGGNHENPHETISYYGWRNEYSEETGKSNRQTMVDWVNKGNLAYVKESGITAYCYVRKSSKGTEFLQTYADSKYTDNLLSLLECTR